MEWIVFAMLGATPAFLLLMALRQLRGRRAVAISGEDQLCGNCGYPIVGLPSSVCPECGTDRRTVSARPVEEKLARPLWWLAMILAYEPVAIVLACAALALCFVFNSSAPVGLVWLALVLLFAFLPIQAGMAIFWLLELRRFASVQVHLVVFAGCSLILLLGGGIFCQWVLD